jgi:hypothetical protein
VPNVLHPNISAGGEEQPMHRDEKKANHVRRERNTNKKYREGLKQTDGQTYVAFRTFDNIPYCG